MTTLLKINGKEVSIQEWALFRQEFSEPKENEALFSDNELTKAELHVILDTDKDGRLSFSDFKGWTASRFDSIAQIASRCGFDISEKLMSYDDVEIPEAFWSSKEFVLATVKEDVWALKYADPKLQADREIVLAAVKEVGWALLYADPKLQADKEIVFAAVKENGRALKYADPKLKKDIPFLVPLAQVNIGVLPYIETLAQNKIWQKFTKTEDWSALLTEKALQDYSEFKQVLKNRYNIEFLDRFRSLKVLHDILVSRQDRKTAASKPLAVIEYPKSDWNGAFEKYPLMDRLTELGYQVFYYEAATEDDVRRDLSQATGEGKRKADLIVLGGHGSATTLALRGKDLGGSMEEMNDEINYLDSGDFEKPTPDIPLSSFIKPNGDLILNSCSNGGGRETNPNNLANTIARHLPQGVRIHASDRPMNIADVSHGTDGRPTVTWTEEGQYTPNGKGSR